MQSPKKLNIHRRIHLRFCFRISRFTSRIPDVTMCVFRYAPVEDIASALDGAFGVIRAAPLSRYVLASIVKHLSDPLKPPIVDVAQAS